MIRDRIVDDAHQNDDAAPIASAAETRPLDGLDDSDEELVRTRRNEKLMALLDERDKQTKTIPLEVVKQYLGLK